MPPPLFQRRGALLAVALAAVALVASVTASAQEPVRDTVVVVRRDTLFVIQRDTVYVQPTPEPTTPQPPTPDYGTRPRRVGEDAGVLTPEQRRAEIELARANRRERLEELRRRREAELAALPVVRVSEEAWAVLLYPTRLLEIDFPAVTAGVSYVRRGRIGGMASVGLLTRPIWNSGLDRYPEARGAVRGLDVGAEFRYYTSPLYRRFPMYVGGGASFSVAQVQYRRFIATPDRTFERLSEADATGRRIRLNLLIGWAYRSRGVAVDLTTGLEYNGRGIFTDDTGLARDIDGEFWNPTRVNVYNPLLIPVMRVGLGIGRW